MRTREYVSVHGGHSGDFCNHASDSLEDIVRQYITMGFAWVGITEHCPPPSTHLLYPDELEAGMTHDSRMSQFADYISECRRLQRKYREEIELLVGMEIETCGNYIRFAAELIQKFQPDYIVGSVHHVDDLGFDFSQDQYEGLALKVGGLDELYCRYFDLQNEMMEKLKPAVVGHFDLIRIFDKNYEERLEKPKIWEKILRNLETVTSLDLILDLNLRALNKGADEPYISRPILEQARKMGISVTPGDDSHGVSSVGNHMEKGIALLEEMGFSTTWRKPSSHCRS